MRVVKKVSFLVCLFSVLLSSSACNTVKSKERFTKTCIEYFDTASTIIGFSDSEESFLDVCDLIEERLALYHKLYDIYTRYADVTNLADINMLYDGVHKSFEVDRKIIDMLLFAKDMYEVTNGETNIAMGSVLSIWHEYREEASDNPVAASLPTDEELREAALHTNIDDLIIDEENNTVFISDPKMTLDVGAVAKGYATEMIAAELESLGISGFTLNIGGNIRTLGKKPSGEAWVIGVENPDSSSSEQYIEYINLSGESFVTSGSYQRFYYYNGKSYHHIIDKDTLYPAEYYTSVSVLAEHSGFADALSTALFSMDQSSGAKLIESIDGVEAMWVTPQGEKIYSSGFSRYIKD